MQSKVKGHNLLIIFNMYFYKNTIRKNMGDVAFYVHWKDPN